jgi:hypothetical protein
MNMNLNRLSWVVLLTLLGTTTRSFARDDEYTRKSLVGLQGVYVLVEPFESEVTRQGLTTAAVQTDAELRLRKAGIRVLTREEHFKTPGTPYLYLNAIISTGSTMWGISQTVELNQDVMLGRDPRITVTAVTWDDKRGGAIRNVSNVARSIRDSFNDMVDEFVNAYLAMNPKE